MKRLRSVLCVDDDDDICTVLQATLCLIAGLDVCTVRNGEEMINIAREWRPDLILMDIMMPGLDGPSTVNRMRANPMLANTPVIFLTAKVMPSELAHLLKLGVLGVIAKPFDPMKLGEQVFALWDGAQSATVVASMRAADTEVPPSPGKASAQTRLRAHRDSAKGRDRGTPASARRSRASLGALQKESTNSASTRALARHARASARARTAAAKSAASKRASRTKGAALRSAAATKAARARSRHSEVHAR